MTRRPVEAIIFDLDGTLVDSLPGIEASLRVAAAACDRPREVPPIRSVIGPPIATMIESLWPDLDGRERQRAVAAFRAHYDSDGCLLAELFGGVAATLDALSTRGIRLFVLTNKPARPTETILERTGIRSHFADVIAPDTHTPPFASKNAAASWLQQKHDLLPATTLIVGDGLDDANAGAQCGFGFVAAAYGYGRAVARSDLARVATLETFSDIVGIVL